MSDLIRRAEAIDAIACLEYDGIDGDSYYLATAQAIKAVIALPSAEAPNCPTEEQNDVVESGNDAIDLISRQSALDAIEADTTEAWTESDADFNRGVDMAKSIVASLPSAQPKTGKWMPNNNDYEHEYFTCSHCKRSVPIPHYIGGVLYDFCPNCGADMRGEKNE